jgi:hypothetical protein
VLVGASSDKVPLVEYTQPNKDAYTRITASVRTGRIDFSSIDPKYAAMRKVLRRIIVKAKPTHAAFGTLALSWYPDDRSSEGSSINLTFHSRHDPDNGAYQVRVVDLHSAPASHTYHHTIKGFTPNIGHDFTIQAVSGTGVGYNSTVDIQQITLEAETIAPDVEVDSNES